MSRRRADRAREAACRLAWLGVPIVAQHRPRGTVYVVRQADIDRHLRGLGPLARWVVRQNLAHLNIRLPRLAAAPAHRPLAEGHPS